MESSEERFWSKVEATGFCWIWRGSLKRDGYGAFYVSNNGVGKTVMAHRYAYISLVGEVPDDKELDHLCRVRPCVNPDHLEPVSHSENMRRAFQLRRDGRVGKRWEEVCFRGHIYAVTGEQVNPRTGRRYCRACVDEVHKPTINCPLCGKRMKAGSLDYHLNRSRYHKTEVA